MSAFRRFGAGLCAAVVAFSGQVLAGSIALSGTVMKPDATPLANVTVRLAQAGLTATTDVQGAWVLGSTSEIRGVRSAPITNPGNLRLENGRLLVRLDGRDIAGRGQGNSLAKAGAQAGMMARPQATAPDTLVYTYNQKAFLRDTISKFDTSGIVRVYDTTVNASITYGTLKDTRDGKRYRTVAIGSQVWMAENLNYAGTAATIGVCYSNGADSCTKYGRMYTWAEVMQGSSSSAASPSGVKGICPTGWHVPSDAEWTTMQIFVDATNTTDGTDLKSTLGWNNSGNGTDTYGFRALPGGYFDGTYFGNVGYFGYWWSASEISASNAWNRYMSRSVAYVKHVNDRKTGGFSLRCTKD